MNIVRIGMPRNLGFTAGLVVSILQGLSAVALLATSSWLISRASERPNIVFISLAVVGVRAFAVGRAAFRYGERILLHDAAFRMLTQQRPKLLTKWISLAPVGLVRVSKGKALQKVVSDVDELQNLSLKVVAPLTQSIVVSLVAAGFLTVFAPVAGLALLMTSFAALLIALLLSGHAFKTSERAQHNSRARIAAQSLTAIEGSELFSAYGWADELLDELHQEDCRLLAQEQKSSWTRGLVQGSFSILSILTSLATAWVGASMIDEGSQPGVLLAVFALVPMAVFDVLAGSQTVSQAWNSYRNSAMSVESQLEAAVPKQIPLEVEPELADGHAELLSLDGFSSIEFRNVSASYPASDQVALSNLNFKVSKGQRMLITGPSGAGKSTVANLLLRFLEPESGELLLNGRPISDFSIASVRRLIGLIEQQPTIFSGTVRQNLLIAKPFAIDDELKMVLNRVGLWSTLERRGGLDLFVGEQGMLLSGGEVARLAMARSLLSGFELLVLDEPTANLDFETGKQTLRELISVAERATLTVILISHDPLMAELTTFSISIETTQVA